MPQTDLSTSTPQVMRKCLVRYADLQACRTSYIDATAPGFAGRETFEIVGSARSNSPSRQVQVREQLSFSIDAARQSFEYIGPQYSYGAAEVFVVHTGQWRLRFGPNGEDGSLDVGPGDVASIPPNLFRGFNKVDDGEGFLWIPRGRNDPNNATGLPAPFRAAENDCLRLVQSATFIDTSNGTYELKSVEMEPSAKDDGSTQMSTPPLDQLTHCLVRSTAMKADFKSPFAAHGVEEAGVITPLSTPDGFSADPIGCWWPHGFNLRRLTIQTGSYVPTHARHEVEVLFVQSGTVEIGWHGGQTEDSLILGAGDTLLIPAGTQRSFRNTASCPAVLFIVRGTEQPQVPTFSSAPTS